MSSMEHLSDQQIARVEALTVAREVGRKTGGPFGPVTPADVPEMVDIAEYVINGTHPMDRYSGRSERKSREAAVMALLESDAMTGNDEGTPSTYYVDPDNVPYLVDVVANALEKTP